MQVPGVRNRRSSSPAFLRWVTRLLGLTAFLRLLTACGEPPSAVPLPDGIPDRVDARASSLVPAAFADAGFEPGRVLVRFSPGADAPGLARANGASLVREFMSGAWIARVPEGREQEVAEALARNPGVVFAEPDFRRVFGDPLCPDCTRPPDGFFEWQWNMHNDGDVDLGLGLVTQTGAVDADIDWLEAYDLLGPTPEGTVRIGILDTGIRDTHVDFCGKAVTWRNFYAGGSATPIDDHGHGTHVAGIAGACANNTYGGVVGVAYGPGMDFVVGKVCAIDGTCLASAISEAIVWATDTGANVINMSFGDTQQSQAEADALAYAASQNVLPVCAAGNDAVRSILFPAADPNCVAVTATDFGDELASYSSFGPQAEVSAPGGDTEDYLLGTSMIVSTWMGYDEDYVATLGTSMAAPHVTGLAALLWALGVTDASDVRTCLRSTADDLGTPGWDEHFGWGRINMHQAVLNVATCADGGGGGGPGENVPPAPSFTHSCSALTCTFNGAASWDPDGEITSYDWSFGDGATASGVSVTHTYDAPGTYTAQLTVTDDAGASASTSSTFSIGVMHIGALEGWSEAARRNRWQAFLDVTVVDDGGAPVEGAEVSSGWSGATLGQDTRLTDASGVASFATESIRGDGSVTFTVTAVTHPAMVHEPALDVGRTVQVTPPNEPPQADFVESCGELECSFTDTSSDPDGTIVSWLWDFGDGTTSSERNPTHAYGASGDRLVRLTVTDDAGATGVRERWIFVPEIDAGIILTATQSKVKGENQVHLTWTNGEFFILDILRNGQTLETTEVGTSEYLDLLGRKVEPSYTYQVCVPVSNICSNEVTVTF
ncbi:MAG: S8 family serine peptidase [Gemmatimonadales bacterium]|nr:MAG: S8 family serine peptidase [Gemmatimonadales bacterium]